MRRDQLLAATMTVAACGALAGTAFGATATQTLDAELGGKETPKLEKKKFKPSSAEVSTLTSDAADPSAVPPKATRAVVKFDPKDTKFNPKAAQGCDPSTIENTTTETAVSACGKAKVGTGSGVAALPFGVGGTRQDFDAVITAFNRSDTKGLLLHSRVDALGTTVVLKGTLAGTTLSVEIPPIGGGAGAIAEFRTKVKHGDYVQARCKSKTIHYTATFSYSDAPNASATDQQKCKRKT